jgi:hypothetical protein
MGLFWSLFDLFFRGQYRSIWPPKNKSKSGSKEPVNRQNLISKEVFFKRRKKKIHLYVRGEHHHLEYIWNRINTDYFEGKLHLTITWFNRKRSSAPRRIVLGSYHHSTQLIRINRYLDQAHIPDYFVSYIVYHEALHHLLPPVKGKRGQRSIHHIEFKVHEKKFKEYDLAQEFKGKIRKNLFG